MKWIVAHEGKGDGIGPCLQNVFGNPCGCPIDAGGHGLVLYGVVVVGCEQVCAGVVIDVGTMCEGRNILKDFVLHTQSYPLTDESIAYLLSVGVDEVHPTYFYLIGARGILDKLVSLAEVSMYTTGEDVSLSEVLNAVGKKYGFKAIEMDAKKADNDALRAFFAEVLPTFDRDRVYPSDIRKLIAWYNLLIGAGFTDFTLQEDEEGKEAVAAKEEKKADKQMNVKANVKTSKSAASSVKTGVGTKRG